MLQLNFFMPYLFFSQSNIYGQQLSILGSLTSWET